MFQGTPPRPMKKTQCGCYPTLRSNQKLTAMSVTCKNCSCMLQYAGGGAMYLVTHGVSLHLMILGCVNTPETTAFFNWINILYQSAYRNASVFCVCGGLCGGDIVAQTTRANAVRPYRMRWGFHGFCRGGILPPVIPCTGWWSCMGCPFKTPAACGRHPL